jgi:hypothetical protein
MRQSDIVSQAPEEKQCLATPSRIGFILGLPTRRVMMRDTVGMRVPGST